MNEQGNSVTSLDQHLSDQNSQNLNEDIGGLQDVEDEEITLIVNDSEIKCLRKILMDNSDYFKAMFKGNFLEKDKTRVHLKGVSFSSMNDLISILKDSNCLDETVDIFEVIKACNMFLFDNLKQRIYTLLHTKMNHSNCLTVWFCLEKIEKCPLVFKAKSMALHEFESVVFEFKSHLKLLNKLDLFKYLAHINLQCKSELDVFKAGILWYEAFLKDSCVSERQQFISKLLECIDFKHAGLSEIDFVKQFAEVQNFHEIVKTLDCIIHFRNGTKNLFEHNDETLTKVLKSVEHSKKRFWPKQPLFLVKSTETKSVHEDAESVHSKCNYIFLYHNNYTGSLDYLGDFPLKKIHSLHGFVLVEYKMKIYAFGGEFNIGTGSWNTDVWSFDSQSFEQKKSLPYPRRHFESCMVDSFFYVVGGTGPFRVIQDNMFFYEFENDKWSKLIELPCSGKQIRCCNYNDQLFIFSISDKCGYFYNQTSAKWKKVVIRDTYELIPDHFVPLAVFCFMDSVYIKGDILIEMKLQEDMTLHIVKVTTLSNFNIEDYVETLHADDKYVYTMYKHRADEGEIDRISLETLDLETMKVDYLFDRKLKQGGNGVYEICVENTVKITLFHHWSLLSNKYVNNDEIDC